MPLDTRNIIQYKQGPIQRLTLNELVWQRGMGEAYRPPCHHFRCVFKTDLIIVAQHQLNGYDAILDFLFRKNGQRGHIAFFMHVFRNPAGDFPKVRYRLILLNIRRYDGLQLFL